MEKIEIRCQGADNLTLEEIVLFDGNPKKSSSEDLEKLISLIIELGFVVPFHIWRKPDGKYLLLDGHQRISAIREMGNRGFNLPEKYPVDYIQAKDLSSAKKILGAISSQYGRYNKKKLKDFFEGIDTSNIRLVGTPIQIFPANVQENKPEIEFAQELGEEHNYVVLFFNNKIDWLQLTSILELKIEKAFDCKPGYVKMGIGRVIDGAEAIQKLRKEFSEK